MKETLNYAIREYEGVRILDLIGNLTVNTRDMFSDVIRQITQKISIVINLENVRLVTSAGVETLVELSFYARENNNRIVLLWAPDDFIRATETLDVYGYLIFADSLEQAATKIRCYT